MTIVSGWALDGDTESSRIAATHDSPSDHTFHGQKVVIDGETASVFIANELTGKVLAEIRYAPLEGCVVEKAF